MDRNYNAAQSIVKTQAILGLYYAKQIVTLAVVACKSLINIKLNFTALCHIIRLNR